MVNNKWPLLSAYYDAKRPTWPNFILSSSYTSIIISILQTVEPDLRPLHARWQQLWPFTTTTRSANLMTSKGHGWDQPSGRKSTGSGVSRKWLQASSSEVTNMAGSTPSHTVRFTDLNIHIALNSGTYVLKWSSGFGKYDYWACGIEIMC